MDVKAINFDFYGTIVDWVPVWVSVTKKIIEDNNLYADPKEFAIEWRKSQRQFVEAQEFTPYKNYIESALNFLCKNNNIENKNYHLLLFEKWKDMPPFDEVPETLKKLKEKYILAICSNSARDFFNSLEEKLPIKFNFVNISDETEVNKPHKKMYDFAIKDIGFPPKNIIHVASSQMDVKGATNAGFIVVWINRRGQERLPDTPKPTYEIRKLDELLGILNIN